MSDNPKDLVTAVKAVLESGGVGVSKLDLVKAAQAALGRPLTQVEAGVSIWRARDEFIRTHGVEVRSVRGQLSAATVGQSIARRSRERSKAMRTLERSSERARRLAESDQISDSDRKALEAAAEKANSMLVSAAAEARKRKRRPPGVQ